MDMHAFHKLTYGLYIISTASQGQYSGCVVNTLVQVTASPIQVSVAINKDNYTEQMIEKAGVFSAAVLTQDAGMDLIGEFGFKSSRETDKFASFAYEKEANGIPYVTEHVAAQLSCRVVNKMDVGSHVLFIAEVTDAQVLSEGELLTYGYYQTVKKGGTPKNASSYQAEPAPAAQGQTGYRCSVCGYILESDTIPEGFRCPICGQGPDKLVKLSD